MVDYSSPYEAEDLYPTVQIIDDRGIGITFKRCIFSEDVLPAKMEAITTINDALNAPVLATEEVLDAMEKVHEAKFFAKDRHSGYNPVLNDTKGYYYIYSGGKIYLDVGDYINADCPLALQVLLGFTTEGVPVNE
jgi:hypothetical protein